MIIKRIAVLILIGTTFLETEAQDKFLNNSNETKELSQKVTELFNDNKISAAIKELKPYWPLPSNEIEGFEEKTIKYLNMLEGRFGKSEGTIKVNEETIKDVAIKETYLIKYQNTAIRLIFIYYRNKKGWIVNSFKWDDSFIQEFK